MKTLSLSVLSLALASHAFALVGGPFSENSFHQNPASATYQGVITGADLFGVFVIGVAPTSQPLDTGVTQSSTTDLGIFGTGTTESSLIQQTSNEGRIAMWIRGELVVGTVSSSTQPSERDLDAVFEASGNLGDEVINREVTTTEFTASQTTTTVASDGTTTTVTTPATFTASTDTEKFTLEKRLYVAGYFNGDIAPRSFPTEQLRGKGIATIEDPTGDIINETISDAEILNVGMGAVTQTERITRFIPEVERSEIDIRVSGVKTSSQVPLFGSGTPAGRSRVTPSTGG